MRELLLKFLRAIGLFHPLRDWRRDARFRAVSQEEIRKWESAGRPDPAPDWIKYGVIRDQARQHGARVLVETGTFYGNAIFTLRKVFREIHSIELAPELYERNCRELGHLRHIHLHLGDSAVVLPPLTAKLDGTVLYWLDGHFCSGPSARANSDTPISAELELLLQYPPRRHVVLIDDARLFTGEGDYPSVDALRVLIKRRRPEASFEVATDIIRIFPV